MPYITNKTFTAVVADVYSLVMSLSAAAKEGGDDAHRNHRSNREAKKAGTLGPRDVLTPHEQRLNSATRTMGETAEWVGNLPDDAPMPVVNPGIAQAMADVAALEGSALEDKLREVTRVLVDERVHDAIDEYDRSIGDTAKALEKLRENDTKQFGQISALRSHLNQVGGGITGGNPKPDTYLGKLGARIDEAFKQLDAVEKAVASDTTVTELRESAESAVRTSVTALNIANQVMTEAKNTEARLKGDWEAIQALFNQVRILNDALGIDPDASRDVVRERVKQVSSVIINGQHTPEIPNTHEGDSPN